MFRFWKEAIALFIILVLWVFTEDPVEFVVRVKQALRD